MTEMLNGLNRLIGPRRREAGLATAGAVVVLFAGSTFVLRQSPPAWPTATARLEPFVETIVESGTIAVLQMKLYSSTISAGPAKIVELAREGDNVRAGDRLVRFDATPFERARENEEAALRQTDAELTRAIEDARLELLRAKGDFDAARQLVANAERGLANEEGGKGRVAVVEADAAWAEAERELARARANVEDLKPLLAESFITRTEFEHAEQALGHAEDQKRLAAARRDSLVAFERPAAVSRAQADLNIARDSLGRQGDAVQARAAQRQATIAAARSRVAEGRSRIVLLADQIDRATVRAQGPGLVVYTEIYFGAERRKAQVGDEVFPNQPIMALPDSSQLIVDTHIREIDLHKVDAKQKVDVRVDAYPELQLTGTVAFIGALAQSDAALAGTKLFPVTVTLSTADARLRTGMTARVEIEVSSLPEAVVVPSQAVFDDNGARYVVIVRNGRAQRRPVRLAAESESLAALADGVVSGDVVLLVDPTDTRPRR